METSNQFPVEQKNNTNLALKDSSRPMLAKLNEDFPKFRDVIALNEIEGLINFLLTLLNIKVSNESEKIQLDNQMALIIDLVRTKFGSLTIPEIKEAFKMYVAKEFPELKTFRILDSITVGEVLTAYTNYRNDFLRIYDQKNKIANTPVVEISDEQKKAIRQEFLKMVYDEIKKTGYCHDARHLFFELQESGKMIISDSVKKDLYKKQFDKELFALKTQNLKTPSNQLKETIKTMESLNADGKFVKTVVENCRAISVCDFLSDYIESYQEFEKVF